MISFETLSYFRSSRASSSQLKSYLMSEKNSIYVIADRQKIYVKLRKERTVSTDVVIMINFQLATDKNWAKVSRRH